MRPWTRLSSMACLYSSSSPCLGLGGGCRKMSGNESHCGLLPMDLLPPVVLRSCGRPCAALQLDCAKGRRNVEDPGAATHGRGARVARCEPGGAAHQQVPHLIW